MNFKIGTRGSALALMQAQEVAERLHRAFPQHQFSLSVILTKGDKNQNVALDKMNDKGIFVKEIENQLLRGNIQLAVHSMKDMPAQLPAGLCFTKPLEGADARDVFISNRDENLTSLGNHARIGTGSKRRAFQLLAMRKDIEICPIRGNVDTRLRKMVEEDMDGILLAAAGLHRLQMSSKIREYLDPREFVPACCQGILAIEVKKEQVEILAMLEELHDPKTQLRVLAERAFLTRVDGGCHIPVGAYLEIRDDCVCLYGVLGNEDGSILIKGKRTGKKQDVEALGIALADELLEQRACASHG